MDLPLSHLGLLALAALLAGLVDSIGGGGGLITVPALLAAGLPHQLALGTNKGQSVFGSGSSLWRYWRAGLIDRKRARIAFPLGLAGALLGAWLLLHVPTGGLKPIVAALLLAAAIALFVQPLLLARAQASGARPPSESKALVLGGALSIVFAAYDGFFGPGTGTFLIAGFVLLLHTPITRASADAKVVNFASNLAALALFASRGTVVWKVSLSMALGQFAGAAIGAQLAVRGGDRLVRPVVLTIALALVLKLLLGG
ncbi:MAG: TSUP family transporter [Deltaproteobacteria bacterium]|nr:TSUP family transporter [Deltaproteobacteria bacterium]